ncbi:MAG: hypothetical protein V7L21_17335 [Nostoc sp.]|nr:hypothetical protein [Nostoc sp. NMS9]
MSSDAYGNFVQRSLINYWYIPALSQASSDIPFLPIFLCRC